MFIYADDTSIIVRDADPTELARKSRAAVGQSEDWFLANKLKMNLNKTQYIILILKNTNLSPLVKFLGLTIDTKLKWDTHINQLASKLASASFAIKRLNLISIREAAKMAYFS